MMINLVKVRDFALKNTVQGKRGKYVGIKKLEASEKRIHKTHINERIN